MHYIITGGSGFIGRALIQELISAPNSDAGSITVVSRQHRQVHEFLPPGASFKGDFRILTWQETAQDPKRLRLQDSIFINLAGENIAAGRLGRKRQLLLQSRLAGIELCLKVKEKGCGSPRLFVQASALSALQDSDVETGEDTPAGSGPLSEICSLLEQEVGKIAGIQTLCVRLPMVLGRYCVLLQQSAALPRLQLLPGSNYLPWISVYDCARALHAVCRRQLTGTINLAAPAYATAADLLRAAGHAAPRRTRWQQLLGRLPPLPCPAALLHQAASYDHRLLLLLENKKIKPERLEQLPFVFADMSVEQALTR